MTPKEKALVMAEATKFCLRNNLLRPKEVQKIRDNAELLESRLAEGAPKAVLSPLEGTYLQWVDLSAYAKAWEEEGLTAEDFVLQRCGVAPDFGEWFGGEAYKNFIRLNLATSPGNAERIAKGLIRGLSTLHL